MQLTITIEQLCTALRNMSDWHNIDNRHSDKVSELSIEIGKKLKLSEEQLFYLKYGAIIHDIGRVGVDNDIMSKPSSLTKSEYGAVKAHPEIGYLLVRDILPTPISEIVWCHHEKFDGTGYPRRLIGENIPKLARIVTVADVWDSLRSDRMYRKALDTVSTLRIMDNEKKGFDPQVYQVFMDIINAR